MNFRRQPFQFTSIDPAKRQAELQKRFGLPSDEMYVDCVNPGLMGPGSREPVSVGGSPRLQHRIPIFSQAADNGNPERSQNVDTEHKPRIRTIPIEVEGANGTTKRHRTFSGPAVSSHDVNIPTSPFSGRKVPVCNTNGGTSTRPKVCNIPIQIEGAKGKKVAKSPEPTKKEQNAQPAKTNGCTVSKSSVEKTPEPAVEKPSEPDISVPLKQIEGVLLRLKTYHEEVEKFTGTVKDKQYRYLDEMLTRCMLDLDNVDTLGLDNIRQSRKSAVKQVQASIDLLETKINANTSVLNSLESTNDVEMKETSADKNIQNESAAVECESTMEASESETPAVADNDMQNDSATVECESTMEASESGTAAMEVVEAETVSVEKSSTATKQPLDSTILKSQGDNKTDNNEQTKTVECEMEVEKSDDASLVIEELSDTTNLEMEESNQVKSAHVTMVVQEPQVEMEASENQSSETEAVQEPVMEMEALDIQVDKVTQNNEPVSEPVVTEPVDSSEQINSTLNNNLTVKDITCTEVEEPSTESNGTILTEITEIMNEEPSAVPIDSVPTYVEETNEVQTILDECDTSKSS